MSSSCRELLVYSDFGLKIFNSLYSYVMLRGGGGGAQGTGIHATCLAQH